MIVNKKAVGVEVLRRGGKTQILAKREVILSAGAIGSSQLLMLSGVGPEQHLKDLNVRSFSVYIICTYTLY